MKKNQERDKLISQKLFLFFIEKKFFDEKPSEFRKDKFFNKEVTYIKYRTSN